MPRRKQKKTRRRQRSITPDPFPEKVVHHGSVRTLGRDVEKIIDLYKADKILNHYYNINVYQPMFSEEWVIDYIPRWFPTTPKQID